nr:MAG: hypothetical protein DIU68_16160 [Chloroflexota bacterium]
MASRALQTGCACCRPRRRRGRSQPSARCRPKRLCRRLSRASRRCWCAALPPTRRASHPAKAR